jgi:hypothetical protein
MCAFWPAGLSARNPDQRGRWRRSHLGLCAFLCALLFALEAPKTNERPQPEKNDRKLNDRLVVPPRFFENASGGRAGKHIGLTGY